METSQFVINRPIDDDGEFLLLYNTRTTAMITLSRGVYERIFVMQDFSDANLTEQLVESGFLVRSRHDETKILDEARHKFMNNQHQHVTILTTTNCNARCDYCFESGIERYDMTRSTADGVIAFIKNTLQNKELSIMWFGGEPLLNFEIVTYITCQLRRLGYELSSSVTTNGSLLTQEMIDFLKINSKRTAIQFSLDAVTDGEYYAAKRYVNFTPDNAFNNVINNIILSLESGVRTDIRFNFIASRIEAAINAYSKVHQLISNHDLSKAYLFLAPLDVNDKREIVSNFHDEGMEHPYLQVIKTQISRGFPLRAGLQVGNSDRLAAFGLMPDCSSCGMTAMNSFVIDADGTLYKCHRFAGKKHLSCGNIIDGIDEDSTSYAMFKAAEIGDNECRACSILPICQGGCIAKRVLLGEDHKCHRIKQVKEELLKLYHSDLLGER